MYTCACCGPFIYRVRMQQMYRRPCPTRCCNQKEREKSDITPDPGGHAAPLRTGADMCKTGAGAGSSWGRNRTGPRAEQPRADGRPRRKVEVRQRAQRGRRQPGARRGRHAEQDRRDKSQAWQLHVPRGVTSQCSSRVEEEWLNASRGSYSRGTIGKETLQSTLTLHVQIQNKP